jgi:leucyl aminopeptidase (aminopeptidase T)
VVSFSPWPGARLPGLARGRVHREQHDRPGPNQAWANSLHPDREPATNVNVHGVEHAWNLPSEEVYTVPDPERVDGHVRLTRPAVAAGRLVRGVSLRFETGRLVEVAGADGVDGLREFIGRDSGLRRLGDLALVDGDSAVGSLGQTFGMILLDENTAAHIALGFGFPELVDPAERDRVNQSSDHLDVSIGEEVSVAGYDRSGREISPPRRRALAVLSVQNPGRTR